MGIRCDMRIAHFCGPDTGGQTFKCAEMLRLYSSCDAHSFRTKNDYLDFPREFQYPEAPISIREFLGKLDIAHIHNNLTYARCWRPNKDAIKIFHYHGRQKDNSKIYNRETAFQVVSTINLLGYNVPDEEDRWFPTPINVAKFDELRKRYHVNDDILRIAHSPTRRDYKGTDALVLAVNELKREGYPVELVLIEKTSYLECLAMKARCDIAFDQLHLQYGNSGLEGMALRQPVLVGLPDDTHKRIIEIVGYAPYVRTSRETVKQELIRLLVDREHFLKYARLGRQYVENYHDYPVVAKKAVGIYERFMG